MGDATLLTLMSVVISALITGTATVIAAYISKGKEKRAEAQKVKVLTLHDYDSFSIKSKTRGFWNKGSIAIVLFALIVIAVIVRVLLVGGLVSNRAMPLATLPSNPISIPNLFSNPTSTPTLSPSPIPTKDPCRFFTSRVYRGEKVYTANVLNKNLNIRKLPSLSAPIITSVQNGTELQILNGPICSDSLMWWEASTINGSVRGWIAEQNSAGTYYIQP
jgi:uncharacterized protein YgiM (DUF1202 family)